MINKIKIICSITLIFLLATAFRTMDQAGPRAAISAKEIIEKVDDNMSAKNRVVESVMVIHGKRRDRTVTSKTWSVGTQQSFSEYLSPAREAGTKMLKLDGQLWIYTPQTDRTIQISGHMLRQSVMGSDMSYEDMMDDRSLLEVYEPTLEAEAETDGRNTYLVKLTAKVDNVAYQSQKMWIDTERFVPLRQELYAKSGQLLKRMELKEVTLVDGRWYPMTMIYKDMLKEGKGTEYKITTIAFDQDIPAYLFSKAALKQ